MCNYFTCMAVLSERMSVFHVHGLVPADQKMALNFLGVVTDGCDPPGSRCWEPNLDHL